MYVPVPYSFIMRNATYLCEIKVHSVFDRLHLSLRFPDFVNHMSVTDNYYCEWQNVHKKEGTNDVGYTKSLE